METISLQVGYGANCYIVFDKYTKSAVVIDPGAQGKRIAKILNNNQLILKHIFLTHGHYDHVSGIKELLESVKEIPLIHIAKEDTEIEEFPFRQKCFAGLSLLFWNDGEIIEVDSMIFQILFTPDHSPGSVCIIVDNIIFSGDTLFHNAIGRTDFIGGNVAMMEKSLKKISKLSGDLLILPGHEDKTTLSDEKCFNPYMRLLGYSD